jgi:hypothetical protein
VSWYDMLKTVLIAWQMGSRPSVNQRFSADREWNFLLSQLLWMAVRERLSTRERTKTTLCGPTGADFVSGSISDPISFGAFEPTLDCINWRIYQLRDLLRSFTLPL